MEKRYSFSAVAKQEQISDDLAFLAGRWNAEVEVKITKPFHISQDSVKVIAFSPSLSKPTTVPRYPDIAYFSIDAPTGHEENQPSVAKIEWFVDPKDALMDEPELLLALYQEAEEEDEFLAQAGLEHYAKLLEEEESSE